MKIMKIELHGLTFRCFVKLEIWRSTNTHKLTIVQIDRVQSPFGDISLKHDTDIIAKASILQELECNYKTIRSLFDLDEIDYIQPIPVVEDIVYSKSNHIA